KGQPARGRNSEANRGRGRSPGPACTRTRGRAGRRCSSGPTRGRRDLETQYDEHEVASALRPSNRHHIVTRPKELRERGLAAPLPPANGFGYLIIPCGSSTYLRAAPLSKSAYPSGARSSGITVALTFFAICVRSCRIAIMSLRW